MASAEHMQILESGVAQWNEWRKANPAIVPDFSGAVFNSMTLSEANLAGANLEKSDLWEVMFTNCDLRAANMRGVNLGKAYLCDSDLREAILCDADLRYADFGGADLSGADLSGADLERAEFLEARLCGAKLVDAVLYNTDLNSADLTNANLSGADLSLADLVETNLTRATLTGCRIYGISAWNVILDETQQNDLIVSRDGEPFVTVDDLEVAQFIYLILNNTKIRNVIDTITSKGVLILGRFADPKRKAVLDGLREKLRDFDLLPMVFDFDRPTDKDYTETVQTLAGMSMFVIADVTNPKSTPLELESTVKQFKIPYIPIIDISADPRPFSMLADLQKSFHWVLSTLQYETKEDLLDDEILKTYIIDRAMAKREELRKAKSDEPEPILIRKKR